MFVVLLSMMADMLPFLARQEIRIETGTLNVLRNLAEEQKLLRKVRGNNIFVSLNQLNYFVLDSIVGTTGASPSNNGSSASAIHLLLMLIV